MCWTVHKHKCPECGFVWEHDPLGLIDFEQAHTCVCGRRVTTCHDGDCAPLYVGPGLPLLAFEEEELKEPS